MRITIEEVNEGEEESLILRCRELTPQLVALINSLKAGKDRLVGIDNEESILLEPNDIYYIEAVDNKVFLYTKTKVYSSKYKLYEIEEQFGHTDLFRASKSVILSASKIKSVAPSFSGRFEATLLNGEKIVISRQYVPRLKKILGM